MSESDLSVVHKNISTPDRKMAQVKVVGGLNIPLTSTTNYQLPCDSGNLWNVEL
jgi:hypothetical protein